MKKSYKVNASIRREVYVEMDSIIKILEQEREGLLGGSDRYINDGKICEEDYRFNGHTVIREASGYEIKTDDALYNTIKHLRGLK